MFRPAIRNGARALKVRSFSTAALTQVRSGRQTVRAAAAGSALLISASFATACDSVTKYIQTTSGLKYRNIVLGKGATAISGQEVDVHYTGWLDGFDGMKKFDSSVDRGQPLTFKVGTGQVIPGWDETLLTDMPVGTKRDVVIPPSLGYGRSGAGGVIPPNATLYFRMELIATRDAPKNFIDNMFSRMKGN